MVVVAQQVNPRVQGSGRDRFECLRGDRDLVAGRFDER